MQSNLISALGPADVHNQELLANVHPASWVNPIPANRYNLVVIGAGTGGLVTAAGAAGLGARVALIERHLMGGDCLNVGCVPSKTLIRSSRIMAEVVRAREFGIEVAEAARAHFGKVMERVRRIRAGISHHDSAKRFASLGIDVFIGDAAFVDSETIKVGETRVRFKKAVIATGARAAVPNIPGLTNYLTNETVFNLTELPKRLAVLGGGPIGCELAQAFRRLGSEVVLFHKNDHVLDREDPDAAALLQTVFDREGIASMFNASVRSVEQSQIGSTLHYTTNGKQQSATVDRILVATGRVPNVKELNLGAVGVEYDEREGVRVDDHLRTTTRRIYAVGDVCMKWKFTHAADAAARIVIQNALFLGRKKLSKVLMPWCTYTEPEIAHVGLSEREAQEQRIAIDTYVHALGNVDRAVTDGETEGFVKILAERGTDKILGATIVATHAGDLISEVSVAMSAGLGLAKLASVIHPYPTQAEAIRKCGDAYNKTRLTPRIKRAFEKWLKWTR